MVSTCYLAVNRNTPAGLFFWRLTRDLWLVGVSLDITLPVCVPVSLSVCVHITHYFHGWAVWVAVVQARSTVHCQPACQWVNDGAKAAISTYTLHLHHHVCSFSSPCSVISYETTPCLSSCNQPINQSINQSINRMFLRFATVTHSFALHPNIT